MNKSEQLDVISSLRIIVACASKATTDNRTLAKHTLIVLGTLNKLFEKEGLEPVGDIFINQ